MKKRLKVITLTIFMFILTFLMGVNLSLVEATENTTVSNEEILEVIEGIVRFKKDTFTIDYSDFLFNDEFVADAGSTFGDWVPIALGRLKYSEDYVNYLASITNYVNTKYQTNNKLDRNKATEWHRISLAIIASGGNPLEFGEFEGQPIDLIADGTYNRGLVYSPGRQGINGWIWGLIALDSKRYLVPDVAVNNRDDFIVEILKNQLPDGGFSLGGNVSDPDITAMALQALAPYYNSTKVFTYISSKIKDEQDKFIEVSKTVKEVVDESLIILSEKQTTDGDYLSWGTKNLESTAQVLIALVSLGIDPQTDQRFIKDGNTLISAILSYQNEDGGFLHSKILDPDNPWASPDESNHMATDQALLALVALYLHNNNDRNLYDMNQSFSVYEKNQINLIQEKINVLNNSSSKEEVTEVLELYKTLDYRNRPYIRNYLDLAQHTKRHNLSLVDEDEFYKGSNESIEPTTIIFSEEDKSRVKELKDINLDTSYYNEVVRLIYRLENSEDFDDQDKYLQDLEEILSQIDIVQDKIDKLNQDILDTLYPFNKINLNDRENILELISRYEELSNHDQEQITYADDLLRSKVKVNNQRLTLIISVIVIIILGATSVYLLYNINKKRKLKRNELLEESDE